MQSEIPRCCSESTTTRIVCSQEFEKECVLRSFRKHTISVLPLLLLFKNTEILLKAILSYEVIKVQLLSYK